MHVTCHNYILQNDHKVKSLYKQKLNIITFMKV